MRRQATPSDIVGDPDWFVEAYDPQREALSFVRASREILAREPFLDYRWKRETLERCELPLAAIAAAISQQAPAPKLDFIWHTSFCCSTLIAEAIDLPGRSLSLREPLVLVAVADAKRAAGNRPMPARLGEVVFRLLARSTAGERVIVKPSNFANNLIEDGARECEGNVLFLYSDLESFLLSIEKGGLPLRKFARRLFGIVAGDRRQPLPWPAAEVFQMSDLEIAAAAWHMQIDTFRNIASALDARRVASLDCEAFLGDPVRALSALDRFFGLGLSSDHIAEVVAGPLFKRHAKEPTHPFDREARRAQSEGIRRRLGEDLLRVIDGSYGSFPGTPRGAPLPGALMPVGQS